MSQTRNKESVFVPPGGLMVWIFILSELFIFMVAICSFLYKKKVEPEVFHLGKMSLNQFFATINTLILITSSFLVAKAVESYHLFQKQRTINYLLSSIFLGTFFLFIKLLEYKGKYSEDFILGTNTFFDYYWILTAFHALHVVIGIILLVIMNYFVVKNIDFVEEDFNFQTGANYWHLCDLIWLLIYPVLYLL